jgi:hypothetical protein
MAVIAVVEAQGKSKINTQEEVSKSKWWKRPEKKPVL